jgi:hypothetical protein
MFWKLAAVVLGATMIADVALAADLGAKLGYGVASDPVNLMFVPAIYGGERPTIAPSGFLGGGQLATISRPAALYSASKATSRRPA